MPVHPRIANDFTCARCGYEWTGRKDLDHRPVMCPSCRARRWDDLTVSRLYPDPDDQGMTFRLGSRQAL